MLDKSDNGRDAAERLAIDVLVWLTQDDERLMTFFQTTGFAPENIRAASHDPSFFSGVLDYVVGDETILVDCARGLEVSPETIASTCQRLQPGDFDHMA